MNLQTPIISTSNFLYHKDSNTFTAEASELVNFEVSQAYDDSLDMGFTLVSHKSNKSVKLVETHIETRENDILWWEYKPINKKDGQ